MFNRPKAYDAKKIPRCVTTHYGDPLTFPSFLSRSFPVTSSTPSLMASKLRPAMSLCRNSFRSIVVFAKKGLSVRYWLNAGELAELKRYSVEQAERWGNFTPKDPDALLIAKELTAAYRNNAESERDAACWASEMAKWESAAGHPQLEQRRRTQKEVQELLEGVLHAAVILGLFAPERVRHGVAIFDDVTSKALYKDATAADDKPKLAEYTSIPIVVDAAYNGKAYGDGSWIQVVVSSNEGVRLLQRDLNETKYGYESFPTASAEELRGAIKDYIKVKLRESKKAGTSPKASEKNFPPPTVDEIEQAVDRYGEWWGRSIRFWILPFHNNDAGFHERMRSAQLAPEDIGKLAAELDLSCSSGPAPLIGSPPIDVSKFNKAFALVGGKGLLEDAVRGLYGNNNRDIDVNHFPRRLLHSVMYSLVTSEPITVFTDKLEEKLVDVNKRPVPLSKGSWELSRALLSPLRQGWLKRIRRFLIFWGKNPSCSEKSGKGIISDKMQTREDCLKKTERS